MKGDEFIGAVQLFFPELHDVVNKQLISKRKVDVILYEDYHMNGFDKKFEPKSKKRKIGAWLAGNFNDFGDYISGKTNFYHYTKASTHTPDDSMYEYDYHGLFQFICDNKEKHMFWFL